VPKGQWTETDCVYRHDLERWQAVDDNTKKQTKYYISSLKIPDYLKGGRSGPSLRITRRMAPDFPADDVPRDGFCRFLLVYLLNVYSLIACDLHRSWR